MAKISVQGDRLDIIARNGHTIGPFIVQALNSDKTPVNLTGATFESGIKYRSDSVETIAQFDVALIDAVDGLFRFSLDYPEAEIGPEQDSLKLFYYISIYIGGEKRALLNGTIDLRGS